MCSGHKQVKDCDLIREEETPPPPPPPPHQHQTLSDPQHRLLSDRPLIKLVLQTMQDCLSWESTNEDRSDVEWRFIPPCQTIVVDKLVSLRTPKSSSSLLTRLDNLVLKAGGLFAQRLVPALIASDLMGDCRLLVDSAELHSVMAMAKQQRETKPGRALVPVITG